MFGAYRRASIITDRLRCGIRAGSVIILVGLLTAVCYRWRVLDAQDPYKCDTLLHSGRWSHPFETNLEKAVWQPTGCLLHQYSSNDVRNCLRHRDLYIRGDSTVRQLFWALARKLDADSAQALSLTTAKHTSVHFQNHDVHIPFIWDPYLNSSLEALFDSRQADSVEQNQTDVTLHKPRTVIIGSGLWHARHLQANATEVFGQSYRQITHETSLAGQPHDKSIDNDSPLSIQLVTIPLIASTSRHISSAEWLHRSTKILTLMNDYLHVLDHLQFFQVAWSFQHMTQKHPLMFQDDGIHVIPEIADTQADLLLNRLCNPILSNINLIPLNRCCTTHRQVATPFYLIIGVIAATFATSCYFSTSLAKSRRLQGAAARSHKSLHALQIFCIVLAYCFVADRTRVFEKSAKVVDVDLSILSMGVCLLISVFTIRRICHSDLKMSATTQEAPQLLPRAQTEEWKGWMQIVILLYHYFGMSKVLWVYQLIRVCVGAYLFLTGYGHATYFYNTNDFSSRRVISVLLRTNLLSCILAYVMNTSWDFYYFPALSSFWFAIVYATVGRPASNGRNIKSVLFRVFVSMSIVRVLLNSRTVFTQLLGHLDVTGGPRIDAHEFIFRASLDLYAPYLGILVAAAIHDTGTTSLRVVSAYREHRILANVTVLGASVASFMIYYHSIQHFADKYAYNKHHPIISLLPILAYVGLRTSLQIFGDYHVALFSWLGRISLETYVLQYHIWLAADTKGLLHLGILDREPSAQSAIVESRNYWMERFIITVVFVWVSNSTALASSQLVRWLLVEGPISRSRPREHLPQIESTFPSSLASCGLYSTIWLYSRLLVLLFLLWTIKIYWQ